MEKPTKFTIDILKLKEILSSFNDKIQLADFVTKAVNDLAEGCKADMIDSRVISIFEKGLNKLKASQKKDANYDAKRKISGSGKPHGSEVTTSNPICKDLSSEPCLPLNVVEKRKYGESGLVMLNNIQAQKLKQLYGNDFDTAITILECYIENNARGKKYKDHYKVLAKGNWVYDKIQQMKLTQQRIENAQRGNKSFAQQERERTVRMLRGQDPDGRTDIVKDSELSLEELNKLYG